MLPRIAHISSAPRAIERRSAQRRVITFGFDVADSKDQARILILNLSRSGMLVQTSAELELGEKLQIEIPEAGLAEATIVRRTGDRFGATFDRPISQAAVSAVLLASPAEPPPLAEAEISAARRSYREFKPVPEWLMWTVLTVTMIIAVLFIYALSFLPIAD